MGRAKRQFILSIEVGGDEPPGEFRIFASGKIETVKGDLVFDEKSAASVMAEYEAHGIDLMVDYDHASLAGLTLDPAQSGKAAGWFKLAVRNGELWAVDVRWTPPAAEALKRKEWRFMSPACTTDENGRVLTLLNVAITNLPATRRLDPLMAANAKETLSMLSPETIKKALEAIKNGDADAAMAILEEMIASAAGGEEAPAEETPAEEAPELADKPEPPTDEEEQAAAMAATSRLFRLTGKSSHAEALDEVETWRLAFVTQEAEKAKLAKDRAAMELSKRKENAITLTKLGAETPHTTGLSKGKLCKRLLEEPLDEQNDRVAALLAARGGKIPAEVTPPVGGGLRTDGGLDVVTPLGTVSLSAREVAMCSEMKIDPKDYAARKPVKKD